MIKKRKNDNEDQEGDVRAADDKLDGNEDQNVQGRKSQDGSEPSSRTIAMTLVKMKMT